MQTYTHAIACTNKLVRVLGESHLKVFKNHFFEADDKRLDREGFVRAVHLALAAWSNDTNVGKDKVAAERHLETVMKDFTDGKLLHLFTQLDCDKDGKVDWMDVSTFMVEGAAIKQTIKQFQDKPEVKEWEGKEVDRIVYIEAWRKVVLCTQSKVVYVYNTSGTPYAELVGHKSSVMNAFYLTAIDRLCTTSSDSTIIIWDEKQRAILKQIPFPQPILCAVSIQLDMGPYLYVAGLDSNIKGYNIDTLLSWSPQDIQREDERTWNSPGALADDDKKLRKKFRRVDEEVPSSSDGEPLTPPPQYKGKKKVPLASSSDEEAPGPVAELKRKRKRRKREDLFTSGDSKKYPVPSIKFSSGHDDWVTELIIINDLRLVISASLDKTIRVWDLFTGDMRYKKVGHTKGVLSLCYMEEYRLLISSGYGKEVVVWNPFTPNVALAILVGHEKQVLGVAHFPNTPTCISMDVTGRVIVWDVRSYTQVQAFGGMLNKYIPPPIACYCLDTEDGLLISMGKVMSWYKVRESAHTHKMKQPISHVLVSQPKEIVVLAAGSKAYTYSLLDGRLVMAYERLSSCDISGLVWCTDDCSYFAVGNTDGRVKVVNTDTGAVTGTFKASSLSGVAALFRVKNVGEARGRMRHKETRLLLILLGKGQVTVVNHNRLNNERPVLKHQALIGGTKYPDAQVTLACYSGAMNTLVIFGDGSEGEHYCEAWNLNNMEAHAHFDTLHTKVTACCMLDTRSCMLTCNEDGKLWIWSQHNFAKMVEVSLAGEGVFVATSISFNESELGIVVTDEKKVKILSFTWIVCQFFEVHKDASWNLVCAPGDQELYRGRYVIEKVIRGTSNEVMLGVDLRLNKRVALKAVVDLHEYQNEVELYNILLKAGSEGVIKLFDHWVDKNGPAHLALECGGPTLWDVTHQKGKQVTAIANNDEMHAIVEGVTRGLVEIHNAGYIHSDIKAKNVVQVGRKWKIIDLDSSCKIDGLLPLEFTPFYCPPEMAKKRKHGNSLRAHTSYDMWSLGIVIYECLCGERIFEAYETCEAVVDWLSSADDVVQSFVSNRIRRAVVKDSVLGALLEGILQVQPSERKSAQWCLEFLRANQYLSDTAPAPVELRPFPNTVPQSIEMLRLREGDYEGEEALFKTTPTPCSLITVSAVCEMPSVILLADHDAYTGNSLLRVFSLRMEYHGRLPTNDYDDTDVNWHFPLQRDIQEQREEEHEGEGSKKEATHTDWVTRSPSILLKTYSWNDLQKKMDDMSAKDCDNDRKASLMQMTDDISPFFAAWKKSGANYKPVPTFYAKAGSPVHRKVAMRAAPKPAVSSGLGELRDTDFIRTLPKTLKKEQPVSRVVPRERCFCGKSPTGQQLQDIHKSISARITKKEGGVNDSTLWIQPHSGFKMPKGDNPKWVADADMLLGMDKATKCSIGHPLKDLKTYTSATDCTDCGVELPCCSLVKTCTLCHYVGCEQCIENKRTAERASPPTPSPTPTATVLPPRITDSPFEVYGGVKISSSALNRARSRSIQRDAELQQRSPPRFRLGNTNGRPKII
eukprot:TRINITY_DN1824_c0_g1_i4.p1 TRINITY_DN1824_c0_g1~~TRINITY_DN1824_c0_g1_i4.p1  ORF type:complete len:1539 (+),score=545.10 TRINITY_DN1824_c0_g1_i4:37-4653(+)